MSVSVTAVDCFEFYDPNRRRAWCQLQIIRLSDDRTVVIATERAGNTGMSITNAAEQAATAACRQLAIDPGELVWIEHYDSHSYDGRNLPETYDRVTFELIRLDAPTLFVHPTWRPMKSRDWQEIGFTPGDIGSRF